MAARTHIPAAGSGNVILFPHRFRGHGPGEDNYRRRMKVYAAVLLMVGGLVTGGVWLTTAIATLPIRDCNFSKHRPCTHYPGPAEPVRFKSLAGG
jgi:hypothetical protein